jgi:SAM-dependent methyltransferase
MVSVKYKNDFEYIVRNRQIVGLLIRDSHIYRFIDSYELLPSYSNWMQRRDFIAKAINKDGTILDVGCANGFLIRCLQEWSNHKLVPYGIDTDKELIEQAKRLFPENKDNFAKISIEDISKIDRFGLPKKFDIIYWNVWDNWDFNNANELNSVKELSKHVKTGGRLIMGFYNKEKSNNLNRVKKLRSVGFKIDGMIVNPIPKWSEVICWINIK